MYRVTCISVLFPDADKIKITTRKQRRTNTNRGSDFRGVKDNSEVQYKYRAETLSQQALHNQPKKKLNFNDTDQKISCISGKKSTDIS